MTLVRTADLIEEARAAGTGVGAFNAISLEHVEAICAGAERAGRAAIVQISENAVRYHHGDLRPLAAAATMLAEGCAAPISVHLDHVEDESLLAAARDTGITSVMYDGSRHDYRDNVAHTRAAVRWGAEHGIWVEAELGEIGGKDGAHAPGVRTDPREAADFVAETGVGGLAVAVGSSHAMLDRRAELDLGLIERLAEAVSVPLVLHGSSGVPDATIAAAVRAGMVKINVGTALNIAFTGAVRERLDADPALVDPRKYVHPAREAMADQVARLLDVTSLVTR